MINDPVSTGIVTGVANPGGNATGFPNFEPSLGGKWVELLKEAAPRTTRVAVIYSEEFNQQISTGGGYASSIGAAASALAVKAKSVPVKAASEIERLLGAFSAAPNGGVILPPDTLVFTHRQLIYRLALQYRLPVIYPYGYMTDEGGLMSYGIEAIELHRNAATYVDRILRGAKVADLPVQFPTKFELFVNLKIAQVLGLEIPQTLLARADKVIE
jgi:putative tryptophan/tyrosine transport system substrate-binding protein